MKTIILLLAVVSLSGCTTIRRLTNTGYKTDEELALIKQRKQMAIDMELARENQRRNIEPGMTSDQIVKLFGTPDQKNFEDGKWVFWYERADYNDPMYIRFDENDRLASFSHDQDSANQNRSIAEQERTRDALTNAIHAAGSRSNAKTCNSVSDGFGGIRTTCY